MCITKSTINRKINNHIPLIRSPIMLWTGRLSPRMPGAFNISLHKADLAQPGMPANKVQIN